MTALAIFLCAWSLASPPLESADLARLLSGIDERQPGAGEYRARAYMETRARGEASRAYELVIYRQARGDMLAVVFVQPRAERGKVYLRRGERLWSYDPAVGKWERRTERARLGGSDLQQIDLDGARFSVAYDATYEGEEKLGAYTVHRLKLLAKAEAEVVFPITRLWVDRDFGNMLKRQDHALSLRLVRTVYYPRWKKLDGGRWYPEELRIYDELSRGSSTVVVIKELDASPLLPEVFTREWLARDGFR